MSTPIITPYVGAYRPITNITPFTHRDGLTYLEILNDLTLFVKNDLVVELNTIVNGLGDTFETEVNRLLAEVAAQLESNTEGVATSVAELTEFVNLAVASIIDETIAVTDPIIFTVLSDLNGTARGLLDDILNARFPKTVYDFGVIGAGTDQIAINAYFNHIATTGSGRGTATLEGNFTISDTIIWDVFRVSVTGNARITSTINNAAKFMVQTTSTDPGDIASPVRQRAIFWEGIVLFGDGVTGGMNFSGANSSMKPAHVSVRNSTITKCGTGLSFGLNAYMIGFVQVNITLCRVGIYHGNAANSGERIEFIGCDITGHGLAIDLNSSQAMHFISCLFSYVLRQIARVLSGQLYFTNCHNEFSAPYAPYFEITAGGSIFQSNSRWLIRDQSVTSTAVITLPAGDTAYWVTNERGRFVNGDIVRFTSVTGVVGIDAATDYYIRDVTDTYFRVALTLNGTPVTWSGNGSATGPNGVGSSPIFSLGNTHANVVVGGGHVSGSSVTAKLWAAGVGAANFVIKNTATYNFTPLVLHNRAGGDLRDPGFVTTSALDDWEVTTAVCAITYDAEKSEGTNSLLVTRTAGGSCVLRLHVPIRNQARFILSFNYKKNSGGGMGFTGFFTAKRGGGKGSSLWSSVLSANAVWAAYTQNSRYFRNTPYWAEYLQLEWDLANVAIGETVRIDYPQISFS